MAYANTSSTKRTSHSGNSRGNQLQQPIYSQAQEHHIYEEQQPYYSNENPTSRQSISGDNRRTEGVCKISFFFNH